MTTVVVTATASCTVFTGSTPDGVLVPVTVVCERVGWLAAHVQEMTGRLVSEQHAARLLRLAMHRDVIIRALVQTWPVNPKRRTDVEWQALWAALPAGVTRVEVRNRERHVAAFKTEHDRLPVSVAEAAPRVSGQILLAAADRQQVTIDRACQHPRRHRTAPVSVAIAFITRSGVVHSTTAGAAGRVTRSRPGTFFRRQRTSTGSGVDAVDEPGPGVDHQQVQLVDHHHRRADGPAAASRYVCRNSSRPSQNVTGVDLLRTVSPWDSTHSSIAGAGRTA